MMYNINDATHKFWSIFLESANQPHVSFNQKGMHAGNCVIGKGEGNVTEENKIQLCTRMSDQLLVLRTVLRLSQADLAERIGVSRQTIIALENNKKPISWNTFLSLILVFSKNRNTAQLLKLYDIYTDELNAYLDIEKEGGKPFIQ